MNDYIMAQVQQMKVYILAWESACQLGAKKNDGIPDKEETRDLKRIHKAVERFTRSLERVQRSGRTTSLKGESEVLTR